MGASEFITTSSGKTPKEAFIKAVREAAFWYGHGGYTGTIAEKDGFLMIDPPKKEVNLYDYIGALLDDEESPVTDKWGPAGCINIDEKEGVSQYVFFGFAST